MVAGPCYHAMHRDEDSTCGCAVLLESAASTLPTNIQGPLWVVGRLGRLWNHPVPVALAARAMARRIAQRVTQGGCHRAGNPEDDRAQSHRSTRVGKGL